MSLLIKIISVAEFNAIKSFGYFKVFFVNLIILQSFNSLLLLAQDCNSEITIHTNILSSVIYLNNKIVGNGTVTLKVGHGKYSILIKKNKLIWNSEEIKDTLNIDKCEKRDFVFQFNKEVFQSNNPQDIKVHVNDSSLGYIPLNILSTNTELKLRHNEYEGKKFSPQDIKNIRNKNSGSFLKTNLFKILVGSAVIFGGTSAYFKLKADDYFDKYNSTKIKDYLDKTHRNDLISGIAFGALQINFAALIYFFLTD